MQLTEAQTDEMLDAMLKLAAEKDPEGLAAAVSTNDPEQIFAYLHKALAVANTQGQAQQQEEPAPVAESELSRIRHLSGI